MPLSQHTPATGTLTTNGDQTSVLMLQKNDVASISISGTWTGTIQLQRKLGVQTTFQGVPDGNGDYFTENAERTYIADEACEIILKATATMTGSAVCRLGKS